MSSDSNDFVPPQYEGYIGYEAVACGIAVAAIEIAFLTLRGTAKYVTKTDLGWDDWLLIPTGITNLAMIAIIIAAAHYCGLGQHETAVFLEDPDRLTLYAKLLVGFSCTYAAAMVFPRLVILTLYLRIFTERLTRWATYTLMVIMSVYGIVSIIVNLTSCIPLSALWEPFDTSARCINLEDWWSYSSIPNVVIDIGIILLPIRTVFTLNLPLRDRIGLMLTFISGGIGTLACVARLFMFRDIPGATDDETWADVPLSIISMVEALTYLVAACLPGLRPLYLYARRHGQYSTRKEYDLFSSLRGSRKDPTSWLSRTNSRKEAVPFPAWINSQKDPTGYPSRQNSNKGGSSFLKRTYSHKKTESLPSRSGTQKMSASASTRNESDSIARMSPAFVAGHDMEPLVVRNPFHATYDSTRSPHIAELHMHFQGGSGGLGR